MIRKRIFIEPFEEKSLQPAGYDLRVGEKASIDGRDFEINEDITIPPSSTALVLTLERIRLPNDIIGSMRLRSSLAREGLIGSFAWVDPGWDGRLTLAIFNASKNPVTLHYGERFVQITFISLVAEPRRPYSGSYQGSMDLVKSKRKVFH